jgi:hypothetical protein
MCVGGTGASDRIPAGPNGILLLCVGTRVEGFASCYKANNVSVVEKCAPYVNIYFPNASM